MPRTQITVDKKREASLKGVLDEYIFKNGFSDEFLADKLDIHVKTFKAKKENPEKFTVKEIIKLSGILRIPMSVNLFYRADNKDILKEMSMLFADAMKEVIQNV